MPDGNLPFFIRLVLRTGIAKNRKQAEYILLGFIAAAIMLSLYLMVPNTPKATIKHQIGDELKVIPSASQ